MHVKGTYICTYATLQNQFAILDTSGLIRQKKLLRKVSQPGEGWVNVKGEFKKTLEKTFYRGGCKNVHNANSTVCTVKLPTAARIIFQATTKRNEKWRIFLDFFCGFLYLHICILCLKCKWYAGTGGESFQGNSSGLSRERYREGKRERW